MASWPRCRGHVFGVGALLGAALPGAAGCSAPRLLEAPIADECAATGLQGCPEVAEGLLLYVEGDKARAIEKLAIGASRNSPDRVKQFADALKTVRRLPGAEPYRKMLDEAIVVLTAHAGAETAPLAANSATLTAANHEPRPPPTVPPRGVVTADTDPAQLLGGVVAFDDDEHDLNRCAGSAGGRATCSVKEVGPAYLTDLVSLGRDCAGQFVAVGPADKAPRYTLDGPFRVHGARLFMGPGEVLVLGQRAPAAPPPAAPPPAAAPPEADAEASAVIVLEETDHRYSCKLLWGGFRLYPEQTRPHARDFGY